MKKIKILKDTPFNTANSVLSVKDFRLVYGYICSKDVTDDELFAYIEGWKTSPVVPNNFGNWFEVVEELNSTEDVPLEFIHEGLLYSKQLDGYWHKFIVGAEIKIENSLGSVSQRDAYERIKRSKFNKLVLYTTNQVGKKL